MGNQETVEGQSWIQHQVLCIDTLIVQAGVFVGLLMVGVRVFLTLLPSPGILFHLLACLLQPWYEHFCLVLLHLFKPCSIDISRKSALYQGKQRGSVSGVEHNMYPDMSIKHCQPWKTSVIYDENSIMCLSSNAEEFNSICRYRARSTASLEKTFCCC